MTPLSIQHVDLAAEPLLVQDVPDRHGVLLVLRAGDLPLGQLELRPEELPVSSALLRRRVAEVVAPAVGQRLLGSAFRPPLPEVRPSRTPASSPPAGIVTEVRDPLCRIARQQAPGSALQVSVILCTRNRPEQLTAALGALAVLDPPPAEVVVVDNAPTTTATRDVVSATPGVRYVLELRPGLSAARNAGIAASVGEVLAFTDDDVRVCPSWVGRLQQAFDSTSALAVTGLVLPVSLQTDGELLFERHAGGFGHDYRALTFDSAWFAGMRPLGVPVWRIGAGANMAFRREVFERLGGFDERLGAGAAGCSEDSEMWYRLLAAGHCCHYEPAAVVRHQHRADLDSVRRQSRAYLDGHAAALLVQYARHRDRGNLRRLVVALPRHYAGRVLRSARRADPTLLAELQGLVRGAARAPALLSTAGHAPVPPPVPARTVRGPV